MQRFFLQFSASNKQLLDIKSVITVDNSTSVEIPKHLIKLFYSSNNNETGGVRQTKNDVLASLIYVLGIECGFVTLSHSNLNDTRNMAKSWASFHSIFVNQFCDQLPKSYRCDNINGYETQLILYQLSNKVCLFIAREIGDGLCITVHVTLSNGEHFCRSLYLSTGRYILRTQMNKSTLIKCFKNLYELSFRVKNYIFMPIRMALLTDELVSNECHGVFAGLLGLPNELLLKVFNMLTFEDRKNIRKTCIIFYQLFNLFDTNKTLVIN